MLTLCKGGRENELEQDELTDLEGIAPLIAATLSRLLNQRRQATVNTIAMHLLDEYPQGVVLLDENLQTSFVNQEGRRMAAFWSHGATYYGGTRQPEFHVPIDLRRICFRLREEWENALHRPETSEPSVERAVNKNDERMQATVSIRSAPGVHRPAFLIRFDHIASQDHETFTPSRQQLAVLAKLSRAERRVAILASQGFGNAQIALQLCIHRSTVKDHLSHIYAKLNIAGRTHLARLLSHSAGNRVEPHQGGVEMEADFPASLVLP